MPRKKLEGLVLVDDGTDPRGRSKKARGRDGKEFKPSQRRLNHFKNADGTWKHAEEWPTYPVTLVCRTTDCRAEGVEVGALIVENVDGVYRAGCGACGKEITEMWVDEAVTVMPLDPPAGFVPLQVAANIGTGVA